MAEHKVITTDTEIEAALQIARTQPAEPLVVQAECILPQRLLLVTLSNQRRLVLPLEELQGFEQASDAQLKEIEILGRGTGLSFPALDVDLYVPALIAGVYGNRNWMAQLGRKGGSVSSHAKRAAARANGAKGGRPRRPAIAIA